MFKYSIIFVKSKSQIPKLALKTLNLSDTIFMSKKQLNYCGDKCIPSDLLF